MTDARRQAGVSPWERLGGELPTAPGTGRILVVGPDHDEQEIDLAEAARWDPAGTGTRPDGPFGLVVCAAAIHADAHPANLLLALWERMVVGGTLLLHSRVLTDPKQSTYARFVGACSGAGETEWLPGRLALRWTVETNGFDIDHWIDSGSAEPGGEDDAYLVARRTERTPALALSTPAPVDGPKWEGEES